MTATNIPELNAAERGAIAEDILDHGVPLNRALDIGAPPGSVAAAIQAGAHALVAIHHDLRRIADALEAKERS